MCGEECSKYVCKKIYRKQMHPNIYEVCSKGIETEMTNE